MSDEREAAADDDPVDAGDRAADDVDQESESNGPEPGDDETDATDDQSTGSDEEKEGFVEGDFVRLSYTARTVEADQLVDTTDEAVAEDEGVETDGQRIEPRVIALGAGHVFPSVEEDIYGREVGDAGSVVVPAAEAFGEYDPEDVRTVSAEKIPEDDRYPGGHVDIDGQHGHVETIIGGRARVDFNHPLAGEDIEYEYEILDQVEDRIERAKGLLSMFVGADLEMWIQTDEEEREVAVEPETDEDDDGEDGEPETDEDENEDEGGDGDGDGDEGGESETETETVELETLYIESDPQLAFNQQWLFQKRQIAQDLIDRLGIDRVIVQETIEGAGGMFGGMGDMFGGMGGEVDELEAALEDADVEVDVDDVVEELEADIDNPDETVEE